MYHTSKWIWSPVDHIPTSQHSHRCYQYACSTSERDHVSLPCEFCWLIFWATYVWIHPQIHFLMHMFTRGGFKKGQENRSISPINQFGYNFPTLFSFLFDSILSELLYSSTKIKKWSNWSVIFFLQSFLLLCPLIIRGIYDLSESDEWP